MAPLRPQLSITLPRNFTFHYTDGQAPQTPRMEEQPEPIQPPPLRPYRVRRRRPVTNLHQINGHAPSSTFPRDVPIPSVEVAEPIAAFPKSMTITGGPTDPGLLAPKQTRLRFVTPPPRTLWSTEAAGMGDSYIDGPGWSRQEELESIGTASRPTSACSIFSDSSVSSSETCTSFPSTGESCTSPEQDQADQLKGPSNLNDKGKGKLDAVSQEDQNGTAWRGNGHPKHANWTDEMDLHLWTTYLLYLQDPTVTPFRADPGKPPPLGVCHRVAREAKRTWRGSRSTLTQIQELGGMPRDESGQGVLRDVYDDANAVKTVSSPILSPTGATTGVPTSSEREPPNCHIQWPRSDAATRRRLRELSRQKDFHSSSRLQRALQSRSPTPAGGTRPRLASPMGGFGPPSSFSTRDMALTLTTSTSNTMHPDSILARLAQDETENDMDQAEDDWFGLPMKTAQYAFAEPSDPRLGFTGVGRGNGSMRLGSPLTTRRRPESMRASSLRPGSSPRTHSNTFSARGTSRRSHVRLASATLPLPSSLKRRAQHQLENESGSGGSETSRHLFDELFTPPGAGGRHRRVRSRGFSLNDASAAAQLSGLFTPPTSSNQVNRSEFAHVASFQNADVHPPIGPSSSFEPSQRLASPFPGDRPSPLPSIPTDTPLGFRLPGLELGSSPMQFTPSIQQRLEESEGDYGTPKGWGFEKR